MAIAAALLGTAVKATLQARRQARAERDVRQAELLLEAGALRAARQLQQSADYKGDIWRIGANVLPNLGKASVTTEVTELDDESSKLISLVVLLDMDSTTPIRRSHSFRYSPANRPDSSKE